MSTISSFIAVFIVFLYNFLWAIKVSKGSDMFIGHQNLTSLSIILNGTLNPTHSLTHYFAPTVAPIPYNEDVGLAGSQMLKVMSWRLKGKLLYSLVCFKDKNDHHFRVFGFRQFVSDSLLFRFCAALVSVLIN